MRRRAWLGMLVLGAGLMMVSTGANGQIYRYPDPRNGGRMGRYGDFGDSAVVQRVLRDLDFAARNSYVDRHDREHFERATFELQRFQDRWTRQRRFDTGNLDRAIDNMKHLAQARQLGPRVRRMIAQDIELLRDFRSQRDRYRYQAEPYPR